MRLISVFCLIALFSCKKEPLPEPFVTLTFSDGVMVLNEGLFQQNNSTVSWLNNSAQTVTNSAFSLVNSRGLGDTGNDIQRYGSKVYVVMNVSSTIEILDARTFKSIKQITMQNNGTAKQPRSIRFHEGKAYIACFDGYVDVLDTTSLSIENRIAVGLNPESLTFANGKMYVSNSGGLNAPTMDSTVSVVDLTTLVETIKINVGLNPGEIICDINGSVYVVTRGDYGSIPSRLVKIDTQNDIVSNVYSFDASNLSAFGDKFLITHYNYTNGSSSIGLFNPITEQMENSSFINTGLIETPYGIIHDPNNQRILVADALNFTNTGYIHEFDENGNYIRNYHVGLNPSKMLIYD